MFGAARTPRWDGTLLFGLSFTKRGDIEHRQPWGEPKFGAMLQTLGGQWGRLYATPSTSDPCITQRVPKEDSATQKVFEWLSVSEPSSAARLAVRAKWTGMTLANLIMTRWKLWSVPSQTANLGSVTCWRP